MIGEIVAGPRGKPCRWFLVFYLAADSHVMAVSVEAGAGALQLGAAEPLFQTSHMMLGAGGQPPINVSPDGQRFLILTSEGQSRTPSVVVVSNWPALLQR